MSLNTIGFIILRHVNNELTNQYWIHCYDCIRKFYPENFIIIIDDNSNYKYITTKQLHNTVTINSEFHGRGELLPYYYYLKVKLFDTAVIIHDSVFINEYLDFNVEKYKIIWNFEHYWDLIEDETKMIKSFNNDDLLKFYENKHLWTGCFGGMSIITHNYLSFVNSKYDISKLLDYIQTRGNRCSFERVIGCLLQANEKTNVLFGTIHNYCNIGITFNEKNNYSHLPLIKVWSGR
jgi:hypothetical protein